MDLGSSDHEDPSHLDASMHLDGSGNPLPDLRGEADLGARPDLTAPIDLQPAPDLTAPPDLAYPIAQDVQIYVDNFCKMDVVPKVFNVPRGTSLKLTYYNRSRDYPVDVWLSYGGGFLDLGTGTSWPDRFEHCRNPRPYSSYADISTACSSYRLMINCL